VNGCFCKGETPEGGDALELKKRLPEHCVTGSRLQQKGEGGQVTERNTKKKIAIKEGGFLGKGQDQNCASKSRRERERYEKKKGDSVSSEEEVSLKEREMGRERRRLFKLPELVF